MNENQSKILSLAQASKQTGYHQDYLGYLCRTGKLEGQKVGRNWITTDKAVKTLMGEQVEEVAVAEIIPVRVVSKPIVNSVIARDINGSSSVLAFTSIEVKDLPIRLRAINTGNSKALSNNAEIAIVSKTISSLRLQVASLMDQVRMLTASLVGQQASASNAFASQLYGHHKKFSSAIPLMSHQGTNENISSFSILGAVDEKKVIKSFSAPRYDNPVVIILASILIALAGSAFLVKGNLFGTSTTLYSLYISNDEDKSTFETTDPAKTQIVFVTDTNEQGQVLGVTTETSNRLTPAENNEEYLNNLVMQNLVTAESQGFFGESNKRTFTNIVNKSVPSLESSDITTLTAGTLAVNGNASVAGNLAVTGIIDPGFTDGSIVFQGASGLAQDNANFYWDDTRDSLGIGTTDPDAKISVDGDSGTGTGNITSSTGTSVTGTGTAFTTQLKVGDVIVVNGQPRTVATIASDTSLTTTTAFNPALTTTPSVSYVNTATTNTGSTESNTLTWDHYVDSTVENSFLTVSVVIHKNAALAFPSVSTITYGDQTMTLVSSQGVDANNRVAVYYLVAPDVGTNQITITLGSSATARMVAQSVLFANVDQAASLISASGGGGTTNSIVGSGSGGSVKQALLVSGSLNANITADLDEDGSVAGGSPSVELGNLSTGSTSDDSRLVVGFANLEDSPPFYGTLAIYVLSGSTPNLNRSIVIDNSDTATGAFVYRSSFLSVKDSVSYEQIKIGGDGQASFHNGLSVDLGGSYGYNTYAALFNGGFVGIGTTAPTNELSVTGDADYSGTLGVDGGAVDPMIGINIESTGAYGGDGALKIGYAADLTATDLSNVTGGSFSADSSYGTAGADHNVITGVDANANFSGLGRVDNAIGVDVLVSNSNLGIVNDSYGVYSQMLNIGEYNDELEEYQSGPMNASRAYYADIVNISATNNITTGYLFQGKFRALGDASFTTIYGINLSGWSNAGSAITTSYGIYMDTSIDVGTTKYALYSSSTSDSYLAGELGIGVATPSYPLHVVKASGGVVARFTDTDGSCDIDPTSTALVCTSDERLKQNVTTIESALEKVMHFRGVNFQWNTQVDDALRIGFLAQEVETIVPELVKTDPETGLKSVNYIGFTPYIVNAIQEQQDEIVVLQESLNHIQGNLGGNISSNTAIVIKEHLYVSEDNIGQAQIVSGEKSVRVSFMSFYQYQPVVVATPTEFVEGSYRITDIDDSGFTIELESEQALDIFFNWHSFAGEQAKLSVSDGSSELIDLVIHQPDEISLEPISEEPDQLTDGVEENTSESTEPDSNNEGEVAGDQTSELPTEPSNGPAPESAGEAGGESEQSQPSE